MNNVLIAYPKLFACQTKFDRKVSNILANMGAFEASYFADPQGFIKAFLANDSRAQNVHELNGTDIAAYVQGITHAIVFDDGEEFPDFLEKLTTLKVPTRRIAIKLTRVINIKREPEFANVKQTSTYEYIGRGSYWGNPYSMHEEGETREEVIRKYKYDFDYEKFLNIDKQEVYKLAGKRLGCFCKPEACHGDVLADYLNAWDDGK
ncbi:MAG: DUF4326 domain-containing protein [Gammaproteobacteria bacterium]|nr:DUF4326 domain-containing protein [Gammaproteobacteria bacterium]|tara:strand:- start:624 stop:1241 length:618 start_codon:yes stop_codon:yes gene_type:complete